MGDTPACNWFAIIRRPFRSVTEHLGLQALRRLNRPADRFLTCHTIQPVLQVNTQTGMNLFRSADVYGKKGLITKTGKTHDSMGSMPSNPADPDGGVVQNAPDRIPLPRNLRRS